jgi:hypothetical protein
VVYAGDAQEPRKSSQEPRKPPNTSRSTNSLVNDLRTAALASLAGRGSGSARGPSREGDEAEAAAKRRKFSPIVVRSLLNAAKIINNESPTPFSDTLGPLG